MTFKLEDNRSSRDSYLQHAQRKRVRDLLTGDIPDDEITWMSNGKISCRVCPSFPVIDTAPMLVIHRNGKKHKQYAAQRKDSKEKVHTTTTAAASATTSTANAKLPAVRSSKQLSTDSTISQTHNNTRKRSSDKSVCSTVPTKASAERLNEMLRLTELRSKGWLLDSNNKWYREDGVEFDSDEEEPDAIGLI